MGCAGGRCDCVHPNRLHGVLNGGRRTGGQPETDCFVVTSICPHSLIDRSIVFPSSKALYVRVQNDVDNNSIFTADGKRPVQIDGRTVVRISKSPYVARLIKVKPDNFYEILRKKIIER